MDKIYTLPDIPLAPYSQLQGLVRRLIEYADLTALRGILDELKEQGRTEDERYLLREFTSKAARLATVESYCSPWEYTAESLIGCFWVDLFGLDPLITVITPKIRAKPENLVMGLVGAAPQNPLNPVFQVTHTLTAGEWAIRDYNAMVIRPATPEEIEANGTQ